MLRRCREVLPVTWGEVKLATLQKMFSSDGTTINANDESIKEYLNSMPAAANEAVRMLASSVAPVRKSEEVQKTKGQKLSVDCTDFYNFWRMESPEVYHMENGVPEAYTECKFLAGKYLVFPESAEGTFECYYDAMPKAIDQNTADTTKIDLPDEAVVLLPLYMAAELYKDDDLSIATYYRNEFETALERLKQPVTGTDEFVNTTGWW